MPFINGPSHGYSVGGVSTSWAGTTGTRTRGCRLGREPDRFDRTRASFRLEKPPGQDFAGDVWMRTDQ